MKKKIEKYIQSKKLAWSDSTLRSERGRLNSVLKGCEKFPPPRNLYSQLKKRYKEYTIRTIFIRLGEFYSFLHKDVPNPYKSFLKENARLFKYVYKKKEVKKTFDEVRKEIAQFPKDIQPLALSLLNSGIRISELVTYEHKTQTVVGKGGKRRKVYGVQKRGEVTPYKIKKLRKELKRLSLTPHDLRRICATKLYNSGEVDPVTLQKVFGWESFETAARYIQAANEEGLKRTIEGIVSA